MSESAYDQSNENSSREELREMYADMKTKVDIKRRGTGFGFSMPMNIQSRASRAGSGTHAPGSAGAGRLSSEDGGGGGGGGGSGGGGESIAKMHRKMRASIVAERGIAASKRRESAAFDSVGVGGPTLQEGQNPMAQKYAPPRNPSVNETMFSKHLEVLEEEEEDEDEAASRRELEAMEGNQNF